MKKCMKYRVEGRRPVGRQRKTWLESVEADMAELEIYKEVHDRSKWRRNVNVMKRKSYPIGKPIIYIEGQCQFDCFFVLSFSCCVTLT